MNPKYVEATEEFFRLRGWWKEERRSLNIWVWREPEEEAVMVYLPNICESMADWIKYVAEFMEGKGITFYCGAKMQSTDLEIGWIAHEEENHGPHGIELIQVPIVLLGVKDHEILLASVLAVNEYLRGKN